MNSHTKNQIIIKKTIPKKPSTCRCLVGVQYLCSSKVRKYHNKIDAIGSTNNKTRNTIDLKFALIIIGFIPSNIKKSRAATRDFYFVYCTSYF